MFRVCSRNEISWCNLVESKEAESSGSENAKVMGENDVNCIFLL
jgi:hypothetical protein